MMVSKVHRYTVARNSPEAVHAGLHLSYPFVFLYVSTLVQRPLVI